MIQQILY